MKKVMFLFIFIILFAFSLYAEERGVKVLVKNLNENYTIGRQYLVLIGINKYQYWPPLQNPVKDVRKIKEVLVNNYYIDEVIELFDEDATKANIIKMFETLQEKLTVNDSLLVFYAGHGHLDQLTNTGFWIPVNAGIDKYEQSNWLPNTQVRGIISNIKAIHLLVISDSCFSGDLLDSSRSLPDEINNDYFKRAYGRISRQILTSGASETVPDASEFCKMLEMALEKNSSPYLDPLMLFNDIRLGVRKTTPLIGNLKDTGHQDGASFLLFLKQEPELESTEEDTAYLKDTDKDTLYKDLSAKLDDMAKLFDKGVRIGQEEINSIAGLLKEIEGSESAYPDLIEKGEALYTKAGKRKELWDRLDFCNLRKEEILKEIRTLNKKGTSTGGWIALGTGIASFTLSGFSLLMGNAAYNNYEEANTYDDVMKYKDEVKTWDTLCISGLCGGVVSTGVSIFLFSKKPKDKTVTVRKAELTEELSELDKEIDELKLELY